MSILQQSPRAWQTLRKKITLWRGIAVVVVLLGVAGLVSARVIASRADATVTTNTFIPVSVTGFVACAGESIALTGNVHMVSQVTGDDNGGYYYDVHLNYQGVSGVGLTTGTTYQASGVTEWSGHSTAGGTPVLIPVQDTYHLISQGSGPSLVWRFNYDVTVQPGGAMTVSSMDFGTSSPVCV